MDKIDKSIEESLSSAAEAIKETSEDLDKQEGRVKKKSQAIKERVRRGARQTSGNLT